METEEGGVRSAVGMGAIWAAAWFGTGMLILLFVGPDAADVPFPLGFGLLGFLAGVLFTGVQAMIGGHHGVRHFEEASLGRVMLSGGIAGVLFAVGFVLIVGALGAADLHLLQMAVVFMVAGTVSAAASLPVARWGERRGLL